MKQDVAWCWFGLVGRLERWRRSGYCWRAPAVLRRFLLRQGGAQLVGGGRARTETGGFSGAMNSTGQMVTRLTPRNGPWKRVGAAVETKNWGNNRGGEP